ncbi:MAG: hypothetical protein WDM90_18595 [Ferruginibacter sp.]
MAGAAGADTMQVTVNAAANIPPTANAGPDQNITLPTNAVNLNGSGTDTDGLLHLMHGLKYPAQLPVLLQHQQLLQLISGLAQGTYLFV